MASRALLKVVADQSGSARPRLPESEQVKSLSADAGAEGQSCYGPRLAQNLVQYREAGRRLKAKAGGVASVPQIASGKLKRFAHVISNFILAGFMIWISQNPISHR